ncbi:SRPBCC family protein [uncultured Polaribacter sp.]|uniref:SRPBCC family protein n=1 Tax=uncultured Polaribacter sp. TaxID=174711 RepID=UPI0026222F3C|nr:SRPBCC family protein [uncultured Polaribacter sp.]
MPIIKLKTEIKADINIVFDLARSIDLHKISTQQTNEEAIAGKTSGLIGLNETVTWRAKHFGIYQNLTTKITAFNKPKSFTDEMVNGAFKSFKHEHLFINKNRNTLMIDVFCYESPFGVLGKFADKLFLKNYMTKLLNERNLIIREFAESKKWKEVLK